MADMGIKMERIPEMLSFIENEMDSAIDKWNEYDYSSMNLEEILFTLKDMIKDINNGRLVISWLRSSIVTGSHLFKIAAYEEEAFVEQYPPYYPFEMQNVFKEADKDMEKFIEQLQIKFTHIEASEIESIRRIYMEKVYKVSESIFRHMITDIGADGEVSVYFGEEMGEICFLGKI